MLDREEGAVSTLGQLGASVRSLDLWDDPVNLITDEDEELDIKPRALYSKRSIGLTWRAGARAVRRTFFDTCRAIIASAVGQYALEPSSGFDDFVLPLKSRGISTDGSGRLNG